MPSLNWEVFSRLEGADTYNFEQVWRGAIHKNFAQFGIFGSSASTPGIEFHLKLTKPCSLGKPGDWWGWQCKYYEFVKSQDIGKGRRDKIIEGLDKTAKYFPKLTDWVLCTRRQLTPKDQKWIESIRDNYSFNLHLQPEDDLEHHLTGLAEKLRQTYFGDLVLSTGDLEKAHALSLCSISNRWIPEVHQVDSAEREINKVLGLAESWESLNELAAKLQKKKKWLLVSEKLVPENLLEEVSKFIVDIDFLSNCLTNAHSLIADGRIDQVPDRNVEIDEVLDRHKGLLRRLRNARSRASLGAVNAMAALHSAKFSLNQVATYRSINFLAVVGGPGFGKSHLAAQITAPSETKLAGLLLHGKDFSDQSRLRDIAEISDLEGVDLQNIDQLLTALDSVAKRAKTKLPIVIDGLNESESSKVWAKLLPRLEQKLADHTSLIVVVTLRKAFAEETLAGQVRTFEISGFDEQVSTAIRAYFNYYRIKVSDVPITSMALSHPLALRMYCEVINPKREHRVGAEAMPLGLTTLFVKHFEQVAGRIAELPNSKGFTHASDVFDSLRKVGDAMWAEKLRIIPNPMLENALGDAGIGWLHTKRRALELEGVLIRHPSRATGKTEFSIAYDAMAGHLIAESILEQGHSDFGLWINRKETQQALFGEYDKRHPLASDILVSLAGLLPLRLPNRQLWEFLHSDQQIAALRETAKFEGRYLDSTTVDKLKTFVVAGPSGQGVIFHSLMNRRSASEHPLNANYLDACLSSMSVTQRDLRWTEWLRKNEKMILADTNSLIRKWADSDLRASEDCLCALWVMWLLTTSQHHLRDRASKALFTYGLRAPAELFKLGESALTLNDPYVSERVLMACYGVTMNVAQDASLKVEHDAIQDYCYRFVEVVFDEESEFSSTNVSIHDSIKGMLSVITAVLKKAVPENIQKLHSNDYSLKDFYPVCTADIKRENALQSKGAIGMDFGNYTIGSIIRGRHNYDFDNPQYVKVREYIESRIVELGYSKEVFHAADSDISSHYRGRHDDDVTKIDRYGKKYSWIAFREVQGFLSKRDELEEYFLENCRSENQFDPSCPSVLEPLATNIDAGLDSGSNDYAEWISQGPLPVVEPLLSRSDIGDQGDEWTLLEGYISQTSTDGRLIFVFLRGVFVDNSDLDRVIKEFDDMTYPGNSQIPEARTVTGVYAGEVPWSTNFSPALRDDTGVALPDLRKFADQYGRSDSIEVEVPTVSINWNESVESALDSGRRQVNLLTPFICEQLLLRAKRGSWDLVDQDEKLSFVWRQGVDGNDDNSSDFSYMRNDLLKRHLTSHNKTLVTFVWGERGLDWHELGIDHEQFSEAHQNYSHIHKQRFIHA